MISFPYVLLKEIILHGFIINFSRFFRSKAFAIFSVVFFVHLLTYFHTSYETRDIFWPAVFLKLPFLLLPFCYFILPALTKKQYKILLYAYVLILFGNCINSIITYLGNMEAINEAMSRSKPFPVPGNHVRFSLMVTMGVFSSFYLFRKKFALKYAWERYFQLFLGCFFIFFLHLASVRSGMVILYFIIFALAFYYTFRKGKLIYGLLVIIVLIGVSTSSYFIFPTIRNKVDVTLKDISRTDQVASANYYPMSARIFSYRVGYEIFKKSPYVGVGIANLKREVHKGYISNYPSIFNHILPHNQYLRYLAAFGAIGFATFMFSFYYPLFYKKNWKREPMLLIQYIIVSISFLFEGTLETQMGLNFSLIFILAALSSIKDEFTYQPAYTRSELKEH